MKSQTWRLTFAILGLQFFVFSSRAQNFAIDWFTIDGGGGTSTDAVFSVTGTIGQPDAGGPMVNGRLAVDGGFWGVLAKVQTPGAPELFITLTPTNTAVISWDSPSTSFALQQNTNLNTMTWTATTNAITDDGVIKFIIINPPSGNRFYRLFKP